MMKLVWVLKKINSMDSSVFYSKILLFGEYGIIEDSKGLSIPYNFFNGALKFSKLETKDSKKSNKILLQFHKYLSGIPDLDLDLSKFEKDLSNGIFFDSSIPQGYGVGSSGAIVAAVYDKYAKGKIKISENLLSIKKLLLFKIDISLFDRIFMSC